DDVSALGMNIEVAMLADEWDRSDPRAARRLDDVHLVELDDVLEPDSLEQQSKRWILQLAGATSRDDEPTDFVPKLKQRFEIRVIVVRMRQKYVVEFLWYIGECISTQRAIVLVADERVGHDADVLGLDEDARMTEVTHDR